MPGYSRFGLLMGWKSLFEIEAQLDFVGAKLSFKSRTIPIRVVKDKACIGRKENIIEVCLESVPERLKLTDGIVRTQWRKDRPPDLRQMPLTRETMKWVIKAPEVENLYFKAGQIIGHFDMRSIGVFRCSGKMIEEMSQVHLLSEEENSEIMNHVGEIMKLVKSREEIMREAELSGDKYPWLPDSDPRKKMTDEEILRDAVDLTEAKLNDAEKEEFIQMIIENKEAFSLRDEIGKAPDFEVEVELHDKTPFNVRPYPATPEQKKLIDTQIKKEVVLGVLKQGCSSYSSPIMLIPRAHGREPRMVTDFRVLNTRIVKLNPSLPLVREALQKLGESECEIFSIIDLKDAYHTLQIKEASKKYCAITPYYGSPTYLYQRIAMGLAISPAVWMQFISRVMASIPNPDAHLAIMDDCLVHSKLRDHWKEVASLLKALKDNGLKISPKKCQFFSEQCVYMGHTLLIKENRPCITPWKKRVDAVEKLNQPKTITDVRGLCGMVNFLGMYLEDLQITLAPIYALTKRGKGEDKVKKGKPIEWTEECQQAFEKIKKQLTSAPVLSMPTKEGVFELRSDTSIIGCGSILRQDGKLIGYYSKRLPECCKRYSITELELTGMTINITAFKYLLQHRFFHVVVDHSALVHIWKAKTEPKTNRLKKLIEVCMGYAFDINYDQGKNMHVSDFLSRHPDNDLTDPGKVIPIAFRMGIPTCDLNNEETEADERFMVMTRTMAKKQEQSDKDWKLTAKPKVTLERLKLEPIKPEVGKDSKESELKQQVEPQETNEKVPKDILPRLEVSKIKDGIIPEVRVEFKGKLGEKTVLNDRPIPEWTFDEVRKEGPHMELHELLDPKKKRRITSKQTRQADLKALVKVIEHAQIHNYQLPVQAKQMVAEYTKSPYFKDIYNYLKKDKCTLKVDYKGSRDSFLAECDNYVLIDELLFRLDRNTLGEPTLLLCVPEKFVPIILYKYHDFILAMHQGILRTYLTIKELFWFPHRMEWITKYINSCPVCQQIKEPNTKEPRQDFIRMPVNTVPFKRVHVDVKHMPRSEKGYRYLLVCVCELTNWPIAAAILNEKAATLFDAFFTKVVCDHTVPEVVVCDKHTSNMSELTQILNERLGITQVVVQPTNKGANIAERYIQTIVQEMVKLLSEGGIHWPDYIGCCLRAFRTFVSPVTGFSPYELLYGRKPESLSEILQGHELDKQDGRKLPPEEYKEYLENRQRMIRSLVLSKKLQEQLKRYWKEQRSYPEKEEYRPGDLVMVKNPLKSEFHDKKSEEENTTRAKRAVNVHRKFVRPWIGPLPIALVLDASKYLLSDWSGRIIKNEFHKNQLKRFVLREDGWDKNQFREQMSEAQRLLEGYQVQQVRQEGETN